VSGGPVVLAVAAAVCVALGSALQHQAAATAVGDRGGVGLLLALARSRRWRVGLVATVASAILHAAALNGSSVAVVGAVVATNLALALPARVLLDRVRPSAGLVLAALVLAGGVAVFVTAVRPGAGQHAPDARAAAVVITAGVALAGLCTAAAARTRSDRVAGLALGLAAGTLYGLVGGVLKAVVQELHDPAAVVVGWPLWTLAALGAWAFLLHQRAYTRAPLQASLPALSVAVPLAGTAFGAIAFREVPAHGPLALSGEALGLAVIIVSVTVLGLLSSSPGRHRRGRRDDTGGSPPTKAPQHGVPCSPPSGSEPPTSIRRGRPTDAAAGPAFPVNPFSGCLAPPGRSRPDGVAGYFQGRGTGFGARGSGEQQARLSRGAEKGDAARAPSCRRPRRRSPRPAAPRSSRRLRRRGAGRS
jgi:drug/metabolite transporter (DMT)-like permease